MPRFPALLVFLILAPALASAATGGCDRLPGHDALQKALIAARQNSNGGLNLDMWGAIVDRSGVVCAVTYTGDAVDAQWPASRAIAAQKANTANGLSLKGGALSTANLYSGAQPGGFLYGIQASNPVDVHAAYDGAASNYGSGNDPMVGKRIGGINVFGGGLALYDSTGAILGALGVSGDTSCADHNIAWRTRNTLKLDFVPAGPPKQKDDNIIYDIAAGKSASGFGHPTCLGPEKDISKKLPETEKVAEAK